MGQHVLDALKGLVTGPWLAGIGRPYSGAYEICRSYEEAREAFELGQRLGLSEGIARASDILVHRVVIRDTDAILDLVDSVLSPLSAARGGAQPLVATLVPTSPGRRGHRGRQAPQHLRPVRHIPPCQGDGPHRPRPSPSRPPVRVADRGPGRTAAEMARHAIAERAPARPAARRTTSSRGAAVGAVAWRPSICRRASRLERSHPALPEGLRPHRQHLSSNMAHLRAPTAQVQLRGSGLHERQQLKPHRQSAAPAADDQQAACAKPSTLRCATCVRWTDDLAPGSSA